MHRTSFARAIVWSLFLAICSGGARFAPAQSVELLPVQDNTLFEYLAGGLSNGAGPHFFVGRTNSQGGYGARRGLLRFDVAGGVPSNATVLSAALTLWCTSANGNPTSVSLHRVTVPWGEGISNSGSQGGAGAPATPGDATWTHAFHPAVAWTTPGGDFVTQAVAGFFVADAGPYVVQSAALVADLQDQLANPATARGWLLRTDETPGVAKRFETRESPGLEPRLTIAFIVQPPSATSYGAGCAVGPTSAPFALAALTAPLAGSVFTLSVTAGPAASPAFVVAASGASALPVPIGGGCSILVDPSSAIAWLMSGASPVASLMLDAGGQSSVGLAIPPILVGFSAALQACAVDGSLAAGVVLSNGLLVAVGQ